MIWAEKHFTSECGYKYFILIFKQPTILKIFCNAIKAVNHLEDTQ